MKSAQQESDQQRSRGTWLLTIGLLLVAFLIATGLYALTFDQPDMTHLNQAIMSIVLGPITVLLVVWGFILRRR
jgi:hypothetical protein